jgi:hypothetical protein
MSEIKFSQQEVDSIKQLQKEYSDLSVTLGQLELEKLVLKTKEDTLHSAFKSISEKEQQILKDLNDKYGVGSLNLETGTFTPNP